MSDSSSASSSPSSSSSSEPSSSSSSSKDVAQEKMQVMRAAKKRKADDRDSVLQDLKKQVGSLADAMSNKPEVVTRPQKDEESSLPSLSTEFFRTAVIGLLGLSTFYFSNIWNKRPKLMPPAPTPVAPPAPVAPIPPTTAAPTPTPPVVKASPAPTTFIDLTPKKRIGASGLLE